jgi:hypothetical protein
MLDTAMSHDTAAPSPDAVVIAACATARAAVAAYDAEAGKDETGDALPAVFDRERLALECVAATRARTPRGIAEKALPLDECAETPETAKLALSLAEDALALVRTVVGTGSPQGQCGASLGASGLPPVTDDHQKTSPRRTPGEAFLCNSIPQTRPEERIA